MIAALVVFHRRNFRVGLRLWHDLMALPHSIQRCGVNISGVKNASRAHVMEVAEREIGRNVFFVPLDEPNDGWSRFPGCRRRP